MPEEQQVNPAPENQETPDNNEVSEAPVTQETPQDTGSVVDWKKRYEDLRPEFDRRNQRLSELEALEQGLQDPETLTQILSELGYTDDDDEGYGDEGPDLYSEVEALKQELAQQKELSQREQLTVQEHAYIDDELEAIQEATGQKLTDKEAIRIGQESQSMRDENGFPDVRAAYEEWNAFKQELIEQERENWIQTKKSPQVKSGPGAAHVPDLETTKGREAFFERRLQDIEDAS